MNLKTLMAAILIFSSPMVYSTQAQPTTAPANAEKKVDIATPQLSPEAREYYLKGAFLRYVAQYVEWPAGTLANNSIDLCVLGLIPFYQGINSINGKVVNSHPININKLLAIEDAKKSCQIVFITKTEKDNIKSIKASLKGSPILTFGDFDNFAAEGGAMNFYIANNKLAILANLGVISAAKLNVNPHMMKLITVVPNV
jgi:hypothetical protein